MFEANEALTRYVEALFGAAAKLERGDFLTHETITKILEVPPHQGHWQHCIERLKARMELEREISLLSEKGLGYRLLTIDEQLTKLPMLRMKRAKKQLKKAKASVEALADESLSVHQRHVKAGQLEAMANSVESLRVEQHIQATLCRSVDVTPKPLELEEVLVAP